MKIFKKENFNEILEQYGTMFFNDSKQEQIYIKQNAPESKIETIRTMKDCSHSYYILIKKNVEAIEKIKQMKHIKRN